MHTYIRYPEDEQDFSCLKGESDFFELHKNLSIVECEPFT